MTNARYRMINDMLTEWVGRIEDETLLAAWRKRIDERLQQLRRERLFTAAQLVEGLRECKPGDVLYPEKRVRIDGELRETVYFYAYQRGAKRLWVCAARDFIKRKDKRTGFASLDHDAIHFHQIARTELAVRRRSMLAHLKVAEPEDDLPF